MTIVKSAKNIETEVYSQLGIGNDKRVKVQNISNAMIKIRDESDTGFFVLKPAEYFVSSDIPENLYITSKNNCRINAVEYGDASMSASLPTMLLFSSSYDDQSHASYDTPKPFVFGGENNNPDGFVSMASDGRWTFHKSMKYRHVIMFSFMRESSAGEVMAFARMTVNGQQFGNAIAIKEDDNDSTIPMQFIIDYEAKAGDVCAIEWYIDSAGGTLGGKLASLESSIGWGKTPSAALRIYR